jgi:hypothetical protein
VGTAIVFPGRFHLALLRHRRRDETVQDDELFCRVVLELVEEFAGDEPEVFNIKSPVCDLKHKFAVRQDYGLNEEEEEETTYRRHRTNEGLSYRRAGKLWSKTGSLILNVTRSCRTFSRMASETWFHQSLRIE